MKKRMMAWLLAAVMIVTQFPATVFATETGTQETEGDVAQVGSWKYPSFTAAYDDEASNETITLLANAEFISKDQNPPCIREDNITIVLSGFALQGKKKDGTCCLIENTSAGLIIHGPGTIETGLKCCGFEGAGLTLTDGVTITGDVEVCADNKLTMTSGTVIGTLKVRMNTTVSLSGGTFDKIKRFETTSPTFSEMLAEGYAYQNTSDDTMVKLSGLTGKELDKVRVVKCTHGEWTEDYACAYCGKDCTHDKSGISEETGKCVCGKQYVMLETGRSSPKWYTEVPAIITGGDDTKMTIYQDVTVSSISWGGEEYTLDLNGHTLTANNNVNSCELTITKGTVNGTITVETEGALHLEGNTTVTGLVTFKGYMRNALAAGVTLQGGVKTTVNDNETFLSNYLAEGAAFSQNDKIVDASKVKELTGEVKVVGHTTHSFDTDGKCACGSTCSHEDFDSSTGKCKTCQKELGVAKVTHEQTTAYYKSFKEAYEAAVSNDTITLLADAELGGTDTEANYIKKNISIVLNGKTLRTKNSSGEETETTVSAARVTIEGPGTIAKGVIVGDRGYLGLNNVTIPNAVSVYGGSELTVMGNTVCGKLIVNCSDEQTNEDGATVGATTVTLYGGKFTEIARYERSGKHPTWSEMLANGCAYKKSDGTFYKLEDLKSDTLTNVTVDTCPHDSFEDDAPKCDYCGKDCTHANVDTDGKCTACKTPMAAKVTSGSGESADTKYYQTFKEAYKAMADSGDTLTLLQDVSMKYAEWGTAVGVPVQKSFTFDLNGHSCGISDQKATPIYFAGKVTVQNGTLPYPFPYSKGELELDGVTSTTVACVSGSSLTVRGNCDITTLDYRGGTLKVEGGSFGKIDMATDNDSDVRTLLSAGYAYRRNTETDKTYIKRSELKGEKTLENVTVTKCTAHGAPTDGGLCGYCAAALEASVTVGENTTYYTAFTDALDYVDKSTTGGATVKVLNDATVKVSGTYTLSKGMTLDLNGKYLIPTYTPFITVNGCTLTVKSSESGGHLNGQIESGTATSEIKVESGKLSGIQVTKGKATITGGEVQTLGVWRNAAAEISGGTFASIISDNAIGSLLKAGYGFYQQSGTTKTWYDETSTETRLNNVTVTKLPITDVSIAKDPDKTTVEYEDSIRLTAYVTQSDGYAADDVSYSWAYSGGTVSGVLTYTYKFTENDIGKDVTVTLSATLDGYTRSTSVTFNVEKKSFAKADYTAPQAKENLTFGDTGELFEKGSIKPEGASQAKFMYKYQGQDGWTSTVLDAKLFGAGECTIYWYIDGGELYKDHGSESEPAGEFTVNIQKATLTTDSYSIQPVEVTYSATAQELVTVGFDKVGAKFWYKLGDGDWQDTIPTATDAGTYSVSYYIDGGVNYNDVGSKDEPAGTIEVTIQPREVTITPNNKDKTYGAEDPYLGYDYSLIGVNTNYLEQLAFEAARKGTLSRVEGEDVGKYKINLGTLSAGKNFKLTLGTTDMFLTINPKDVSDVITELNKQTVFTGIGEIIEPSFEDNGNAITGTLTYSGGIKYSELKSILADYDAGKTAVFEYTFTANGNYTGTITGKIEVTFVDVVFDVAEGAITIKTNGTYGDSWNDLVTLDPSKITATRAGSEVEGTYCIVTENGTLNDLPKAGKQNFKVVFNSKDYKDITVTSGSVTLAQKELTVTAGTVEISKIYDGTTNMGTLSGAFEIEGTVGSDKVSIQVNSWPSYTNENVGVYTGTASVVLGSMESLNYTLTSGSVTIPMEITKATLTASEVTATAEYGTKVKDITVSGEVKFGEIEMQGTWSFDSKDETIPNVTTPGTYTATFTVADASLAGNFNTLTVEVTPTITPKAVTAVLTVPDKQYDGKTDTVVNATIDPADLVSGDSITITGLTGTFAQSDVGENLTVKVDDTDKTITGAENYTVTIPTGDIKGNIVNTWQPKNGTEFATPATNGAGWLTEIPTITAKEGYKISLQNKADDKSWAESYLPSSAETTEVTFYVRNETTGAISLPVTYTYKLDKHEGDNKTIATVSIEGIEDVWEGLVEDVYFDQFLKENATIKVKAKDAVSGVKKVEYLDSATVLSVADLQSRTDWSVMSTTTDEDGYAIGTVTIPAVDGKQFVCYIRITDNADNVTYFSTDGAEFDTTPPTISGVESGETAYTTRVITISDRNLAWVTVNGEPVELNAAVMPLSLAAVATSEPGVTLTLSGNKEQDYVIKIGDWAGHISTFTIHMKPISSITAAASGLTAGNVTSDSKTMLEGMKTTLAKELTNGDLTPAEKQVLEQEQQKVTVLQNKLDTVSSSATTDNIQNAEGITESNIKREDETKLENAKADLEKALTDHKDNLTDDEKKALNDQLDTIDKALKAIENVENVEKVIGDLSKDITSKDSEAVKEAEKTYNALTDREKSLVSKETVEKLQAAQKTLDRLNTKANAPATGDDSHIVLWCSLLLLSATALAVLDKKRKMSR